LGLKDKLKGVLLFYRRRAKYKPKPKNLRRSLALDKAKTAKTVYDKPPKNWNPKKSDVRGIDTPSKTKGKIKKIVVAGWWVKKNSPRGDLEEITYFAHEIKKETKKAIILRDGLVIPKSNVKKISTVDGDVFKRILNKAKDDSEAVEMLRKRKIIPKKYDAFHEKGGIYLAYKDPWREHGISRKRRKH